MRLSILVCALALVASQTQAASARWIGTWAASPAPPMQAAPPVFANLLAPPFNNQTLVQVVRVSAGGQRLRIRFTNEYGTKPLAIGAARVALVGPDGASVPGSDRAVTFAGEKATTIPAGAPMVSDPVALPTTVLARLRISLYLPGEAPICTCHINGNELVQVAQGDWTERATPAPSGPAQYRAFLSGVEVETAQPAKVIVTFGDSITDGYLSSVGANHRWPDRLAERLAAKYPGRAMAVANAGIGGNRVLSDGPIAIFGQSALTRFDRDVLAIPGATHVVLLEGVNDLGDSKTNPPTAQSLIVGYRQIIDRAHAHGLKVIGATILPYGGAAYFGAPGEVERQTLNAWIRKSGNFDGVIDFDAATRDPAKPDRMRADLQSGDWLHPNDAGYRAMGEAVDLSLFQ
ncbi:MAG: SGNH/GDSL hydrolase family protein [Phenylobacterium sp.]